MLAIIVTLFLALSASVAIASGLPSVPEVDPIAYFLRLILDWQTLTPLTAGMALVVLAVQVLKSYATGFQHKRLAVTVLSVVYAVLLYITQSMGVIEALVAALITGGGAVAIYEAWKGIAKTVGLAK